jgi:hypothetical protein
MATFRSQRRVGSKDASDGAQQMELKSFQIEIIPIFRARLWESGLGC